MMDKVMLIDASQILTIIRRAGLDGLNAVHSRGEYFFFSDDLRGELIGAHEWNSKNGHRFQEWLKEQRVNGRLIEVDVRVTQDEYRNYDLGKRGTSRGGKELSDMSIRKFMLQNKNRFTFEVISRDLGLLDHKVFDPAHPLYGLQFARLSTRSALTWLATHPDVPHNPERLQSLLQAIHNGKFDLSRKHGIATHELERETYHLPETYEDAVSERTRRAETDPRRRSDMRDLNGQAAARLGGAPAEPGARVPITPSGTLIEGQAGSQIDLSTGIAGKVQGSLQEGPSIGRRFMNLARKGAPVAVLGIAAVPVFSMVEARAAERNIPFDQAARELGIEFGEDEFRDLLAEVGADAAITAIPVAGWLKKAWDVLGNIDDIVAVTQLYGAAYPENETIQQMAGIADAVESSTAFGVYVEGRDALTGAVGSVIDGLFGSSPNEDQLSRSLGNVQQALITGGGAVEKAVLAGASQEEMADVLKSEVNEISASSETLSNVPVAQSNLLSPETTLAGDEKVPLSGVAQIAGSQPILPPAFETEQGHVNGSAASAVKSDPFQRKTSYDRYQSFGFRPEEKAQALDEHKELLRKSYLDMNGHEEAAEMLAVERFLRKWGPSAFAPDADGTVMKYPVEKVYSGLEDSGHAYVRDDVEEFLAGQGIKAGRWYLSPNEKTGQDWELGWTDDEGYGPRMTLAYEDAAGRRHQVTDSFQANVRRASQRQSQKPAKGVQGREAQSGAARPEPAENAPQKFSVPVPRLKPEMRPVGH
jgi:hypothetical protein